MLTVAYCRVSTEEQAAEGWSIAGQAAKLRAYADLRDLGPVTVIEDPGRSGKDTNRPGLQQLLQAVERGHVSSVLIWRLDRLSRNLGDLILLADTFGKAGVGLYSFTEQIDLASATGRMFYNILGAFAQFYREQLAENVTMGMGAAVRQGKWINRPKTGYDLIDGDLVPNELAPVVQRIFRLRAEGISHRGIEAATGIKYSTVMAILKSRIYRGEVQHRDEWFPGKHEALVSAEQFEAAQRGYVAKRRQSADVLSGRVRCGLCGKAATVQYNQDRKLLYRCHHRGSGCSQPSRSASGLLRAALLGLRLIGGEEELQEAIRRQLRKATQDRTEPPGGGQRPAESLASLNTKRQKLLDLYYGEKITADYFAEQELVLSQSIEAVRSEAAVAEEVIVVTGELSRRFEEVAAVLRDLDLDRLWTEATDKERRVLIHELVERIAFFPDHLEVTVAGAPAINVALSEVGLKESRTVGVGGGT